jgi:hypothetical protein
MREDGSREFCEKTESRGGDGSYDKQRQNQNEKGTTGKGSSGATSRKAAEERQGEEGMC